MDVNGAAVVGDEAALAKAIEEEADPGASGADHFGEGLLADAGDGGEGGGAVGDSGHVEEKAGETFLAGVENVVGEIGLHAEIAGGELGDEFLGDEGDAAKEAEEGAFFEAHDGAALDGNGSGDAYGLAGKTAFSEEGVLAEDIDDGLFAIAGDDAELNFAVLDVKDGVGGVALEEDAFAGQIFVLGAAGGDAGEQGKGVPEQRGAGGGQFGGRERRKACGVDGAQRGRLIFLREAFAIKKPKGLSHEWWFVVYEGSAGTA